LLLASGSISFQIATTAFPKSPIGISSLLNCCG
jgi:hypothetical protein